MNILKRVVSAIALIFTFCLALYSQTNEAVCPQISLVTPQTVILRNSPVFFAIETDQNTGKQKLQYDWSFSSGRILEGQNTSKVMFIVENQEDINIHVSVNISGLPEKCIRVFEDTVGVIPLIEGDPVDKFGKVGPHDLKARLDNFIVALSNDPESTGLIQIAFDKKDGRKYKAAQFKQMLRFFGSRGFDLNRIIIEYSTGGQENTIYWICPSGAEFPKPLTSSYKIIQGPNLRKEINSLSSKKQRL